MPYFKSVGHISDELSPSEQETEYRRKWAMVNYHNRRGKVLELLGGKCATCSTVEDLIVCRLKDEGIPKFRSNNLHFMSEAKLKTLLPFCTLLCREHAHQFLFAKGRVTHGTHWAAYKHKCTCDECEEYRADFALRRREDRKAARGESAPVTKAPAKKAVSKKKKDNLSSKLWKNNQPR